MLSHYIKSSLKMTLVVSLSCFLLACAKKSEAPKADAVVASKPVQPQLTIHDVVNRIKQQGGVILHYGQTVRVVMPIDLIFKKQTASYTPQAGQLLSTINTFLGFFDLEGVSINVYLDSSRNLMHAGITQSLSDLQAAKVQSYFSYYKLDARLLVAEGKKMDYVATNHSRYGQSQNNRLEINFKYLVPTHHYR